MSERPTKTRHGVTKLFNQYADLLSPEFYNNTPKAVFAAIAVSLAIINTGEGDCFDGVENLLRDEWAALYKNKIVPQKPKR